MQRTTLFISLSAEIMITGRSRRRAWSLSQFEHLIAVDLRHHHVEQHEVKAGGLQAGDRLLAVMGALDIGVAFELEIKRQRVAVVIVVIDDKDAGDFSDCRPLADRFLSDPLLDNDP